MRAFLFFLVSGATDVGNLCRCVCSGLAKENSTIVIPSELGCSQCTSALCTRKFVTQCELKNTITTHCVDRYALLPRAAIIIIFLLTGLLTIVGLCKDRIKVCRVLYSLGTRSRRARA
mmetsp:Transcript_3348/g.5140  ORF Transcript_3348/g.5140 Transcript_3348/m.5140 type:complete len:118 (-) Transcript_3348:129-482(-)